MASIQCSQCKTGIHYHGEPSGIEYTFIKEDECVSAFYKQRSIDSLDYVRWSDRPEKYKHRLIVDFLNQEVIVRDSLTGTENVNLYSVECSEESFSKLIKDTGILEFDITDHYAETGKTREGFVCKCKIKFRDGNKFETELNQVNPDNPLEKVLLWLKDYDDRLDMAWFI